MNAILAASFLTVPLVAARPAEAASPGRAVEAREALALRQLDTGQMDGLRAGALDDRASTGLDERAALRAAESTRPDLADLRAGDLNLSDRDLTIIGVVLLVVLLIVLI